MCGDTFGSHFRYLFSKLLLYGNIKFQFFSIYCLKQCDNFQSYLEEKHQDCIIVRKPFYTVINQFQYFLLRLEVLRSITIGLQTNRGTTYLKTIVKERANLVGNIF